MKFKTKLVGTYIFIIVAVLFLSVFTIIKANSSKASANFILDKISVSLTRSKQVKVDIIQIQQWLTDASVTGYLDGFDTAEEYFQNANKLLDQDIEQKEKLGKEEISNNLKGIKVQLAEYYEVGTVMAHQYIDNGREVGNVWMGKFDPVAEKLGGMIDKQVEGYSAVYKIKFVELLDSQDKIIQMLIIISIIVILVIIVMGISLFSTFNKGSGLISGYAEKLENNDISDSALIKRKDEFGMAAGQFNNSFKLLNGF